MGIHFRLKTRATILRLGLVLFSGLEKVIVNGVLVSSQRNFSKYSSYPFKVGENEYSTSLQTESLLRGPCVCTLSKNGKAYKRKKLTFSKEVAEGRKAPVALRVLFYIVLGIVFGYTKNYFNLPDTSAYTFLAILFLIVFAHHYKSNKRAISLIEDEKIV